MISVELIGKSLNSNASWRREHVLVSKAVEKRELMEKHYLF